MPKKCLRIAVGMFRIRIIKKSKIAINKDFFHESSPVCHDFGKFCIGFVSQ